MLSKKMLWTFIFVLLTLLLGVRAWSQKSSIATDPRMLKNRQLLTRQPSSPRHPFVIGGSATEGFLEVTGILDKDGNRLCSGTLATKRQVITAKHCVCKGIGRRGSPVIFGPNLKASQDRIRVSRTEKMGPCEVGKGSDIAILWLEKDAPATFSPRDVAIVEEVLNPAVGIYIVGYGLTDLSSQRAGVKFVADVPITTKRCNESQPGQPPDPEIYGCVPEAELVAGKTALNKDTCPGDSGGPALIRVSPPKEFAYIGVTSRKVKNSSRDCGDGGVYELLDGERAQFLIAHGITPVRVGN